MAESEIEAHNRLLTALTFADEKAWKYPFAKMCKNYGKVFIEMLQASWAANHSIMRDSRVVIGDYLTEEEFCYYNDLPKGFFENKIKNIDYDEADHESIENCQIITNIREKEK